MGDAKRLAALDGLRAFAVILVVATHSAANLPIGGVGVLLFFVLSGYLITTVLIRERDSTGRISLRLFYLRRAIRLYPALIVMLVVTVALGAGVGSALMAATYTTNLFNSFGIGSSPYGHTWSLAIEEQFYLLWPFLLPMVLRRQRHGLTVLVCLTLASALAGWAFGPLTHGMAGVRTFNPVFRAYGLIAGCALALYLYRRSAPLRRPALLTGVGLGIVVVSLAVAQFGQSHHGIAFALGGNGLLAVIGGVAMVAGLVGAGAVGVGRFFRSRLAVWIGTRSYAIYLWHVPLISLGQARGWSLSTAALVGVPASVILSGLSYRFVERPLLRFKDRRLHPASVPASTEPDRAVFATSTTLRST